MIYTAITNKNVQYFGIPKSEEYAREWVIAAGRDDLLEKPLINLIKYSLCSEHFTDECFTNATRTYLKKQSRPKVIVPIPTIFKNNIKEFVPDVLKPFIADELDDTKPTSHGLVDVILRNNTNKRIRLSEGLDQSNVNVVEIEQDQDSVNQSGAMHVYYVENTPEPDFNVTKLIEEDSPQNDLKENEIFIEQLANVCRLCANSFLEDLVPIYGGEDTELSYMVDRLMPNMVLEDDGRPQSICEGCYEQVKQCILTIDGFYATQNVFESA